MRTKSSLLPDDIAWNADVNAGIVHPETTATRSLVYPFSRGTANGQIVLQNGETLKYLRIEFKKSQKNWLVITNVFLQVGQQYKLKCIDDYETEETFEQKLVKRGFKKVPNQGFMNKGIYLSDNFCYKIIQSDSLSYNLESFAFSKQLQHVVTIHEFEKGEKNLIGIKMDRVQYNMSEYFQLLYNQYGHEAYRKFVDRIRKIIKFQMLVTDRQLEECGLYQDDRKLDNIGICVYKQQPAYVSTTSDGRLKYVIEGKTFSLDNRVPSIDGDEHDEYLIFKFMDIDDMVNKKKNDDRSLNVPNLSKSDRDKLELRKQKIGCYYNFYDIYAKYKSGHMIALMVDSDNISYYKTNPPAPNVWSNSCLPYIFECMKDKMVANGNYNTVWNSKDKDKNRFIYVSNFNDLVPINDLVQKLNCDKDRFMKIMQVLYADEHGMLKEVSNG